MSKTRPTWKRLLLSEYLVLVLSLLWFAVLAPFTPGLASPQNLANIFSAALPLLVVAIGQTIVVITGGIDLSATSIIALASTAGALLVSSDHRWLHGSPWAVPGGILAMIAIGVVVGALNGLAVALLRMPPFMVTLTTMMFFSGYAIWLTRSMNIYHLPPGFTMAGQQVWITVALCVSVALAAHFLLMRTLLGQWIYAVGSNVRTARVSGVPVHQVVVTAYVLSGIFAAIAALLYTGRLETGSPVMGQRILLDVIGAVVIGGTSLFGGRGQIVWTVFGVLFMSVIDNTLNLLGLSNFSILIAKGLVILGAALLDSARNRYAAA